MLRAMNPSGDGARRSLRFSFGRFNTEAQIDRAIEIVPKVIEKLRQTAARGSSPQRSDSAPGSFSSEA